MKKFIYKYSHVISSFALVMTTLIANRTCTYVFHQPELPESAKKLRKF
ncbi:MAG: cyclic lactone autoinducer peptide [Bacilli bacterium]